MSNEGTQDVQIGEALLLRVVQDQIPSVVTEGSASHLFLSEVQPLNNEQDQKLLNELAKTVKMIGDQLNHEKMFNNLIDSLACQSDEKIFLKLVEGVFNDGQINWGRIIVLFYAVGKLALKMVLANLPALCSTIVDSCLNFFRTKLVLWIRSVGGWISSISALTQFSIEHISTSSFCSIPSSELIVAFICGIVLGSAIVWKLSRSS